MEKEIDFIDLENAKDQILFQLINTKQNRELLEKVPNRGFHDLSIVYRYVKEKRSIMIQKTIAKVMNLTEEQLFEAAVKNTRRIFPPLIRTFNDIMKVFASGLGEDFIPQKKGDMVFVIGNKENWNGAVALLYQDILHELTEKLGDIYILPSSVHEGATRFAA